MRKLAKTPEERAIYRVVRAQEEAARTAKAIAHSAAVRAAMTAEELAEFEAEKARLRTIFQ